MRELSVLAQQADEPVKSVATPPIRRAESRRGTRKRCEKVRQVRDPLFESAQTSFRDGGAGYRRWAKVLTRCGLAVKEAALPVKRRSRSFNVTCAEPPPVKYVRRLDPFLFESHLLH